jgi:hypothetical protein
MLQGFGHDFFAIALDLAAMAPNVTATIRIHDQLRFGLVFETQKITHNNENAARVDIND